MASATTNGSAQAGRHRDGGAEQGAIAAAGVAEVTTPCQQPYCAPTYDVIDNRSPVMRQRILGDNVDGHYDNLR